MPWAARAYTIAGVVGSVKVSAIDVDSQPTLYFSAGSGSAHRHDARDSQQTAAGEIARDVERIAAGIDRDQPVYECRAASGAHRSVSQDAAIRWCRLW